MRSRPINIKHIKKDAKRLDGIYFLNDNAFLSLIMEDNQAKCRTLSEFASTYNPPVFKRQFCKNTERAVSYFQSSDVPNQTERSEVFINKKQAVKLNTIVKKNQILITGFGTIGNTRLVSKLQDGVAYANNVCRVDVNDDQKYGFIYAFISSKYGRAQLNKNASGSVVRYIEAPGIRKILIPLFSTEKQKEIHSLIVQAAGLREKANQLIEEGQTIFNSFFHFKNKNEIKIKKIRLSDVEDRIDATYVINNDKIQRALNDADIKCVSIGEIAKDIFIGPRSKRNYTKKGVPFLSGSELQKINPTKVEKFLSLKEATPFIVKQGWILVSRSGTIGNTTIMLPILDNYAVTDDAIRITLNSKSKISINYLYAFLISKIGKMYLESGAFGSVIQHINEDFIKKIKVPILDDIYMTDIDMNMEKCIDFLNTAIIIENKAIQLVETEIDQWQQ